MKSTILLKSAKRVGEINAAFLKLFTSTSRKEHQFCDIESIAEKQKLGLSD